jgi:ADP-ribose pyrophosphatase YjhB (NUDIX family)
MVVFTIKNKIIEDYRKLAHKEFSLLLIKRGEHPYMNEWALPGGFVRGGESVEETAYRELVEETGVKEISLTQLHCFSEPKRDPRGWIISNAFIALAEEEQFNLRSGDDAIDARWFCVNYELVKTERETQGNIRRVTEQYQLQLKHEEDNIVLSALIEVSTRICSKRRTVEYKILESEGIAFDHGKIIAYGINDLRERVKTTTIAFDLLPELFTLTDLQKAHELILNEKLLVANFRRKMTEFVIETDNMVEGQGHRPSKLFMQKL